MLAKALGGRTDRFPRIISCPCQITCEEHPRGGDRGCSRVLGLNNTHAVGEKASSIRASARLGCETFDDHQEEMVLADVSMSSDGYFPAEKALRACVIYETYWSPTYETPAMVWASLW